MAQSRTAGLDLKVIEDKEVLFHFADNPRVDKETGTLVGDWHSGGIESNDSSWDETREMTSNTQTYTGGQSSTSHTAGAITGTANLIPGSPVLDHLEWPDTKVVNGVTIRAHNNTVALAHVCRVHRFQGGIVGMKVSREKAALTVPTRTRPNDAAPQAVNITYENDETGHPFEELYYHISGTGEIVNVEPKIFKTVADLQTQVDAGTAFVSDAAKGEKTAMVPVETTTGDATLREYDEPEETTPAGE